MRKPLSVEQQDWVEGTFDSLSLHERVAQLLIPNVGMHGGVERMLQLLHEIPVGSVFVAGATRDEHLANNRRFQEVSRVPLVVAADLECGAGHIVEGMVPFPDPLALAAANSEELAYTLGRAAAVEGRSVGIHWTYAPVVDVNVNPDNPIANTRSLGDDPPRVARLAVAMLRGMQEHGLAACAKHFPGDGVDDMDQHTVTTVNHFSRAEWFRVSGHTFKAAFSAGVLSTMIGHIALPAWENDKDARGCYRPATVSPRLVTELLRGELGYRGLIITDDMNMGGVAGYMNRRDRTVACIAAGCDMLLFPKLPGDYHFLLEAVESGVLSEARVDEAVKRVLAFKARLHLHRGESVGPAASREQRAEFEAASRRIAEGAIYCVRDLRAQLPVTGLGPGSRVLTVTLSVDGIDVPEVDAALWERGFEVEHMLNPHDYLFMDRAPAYDAIFLNFVFKAAWGVQSVRSVGVHNRIFIGGYFNDHPCAIFTSFGSPYHLRMFSTLPNYINVHASSPDSQRAAVAAWFGEVPMSAESPVANLTRFH